MSKKNISVEEADEIILSHIPYFSIVEKPLLDAYGSVLGEDLIADRDLPPFNQARMDGIAINHYVWKNGRREFGVCGVQAAGQPPLKLTNQEDCVEIMTGAILPEGCDCVVPIEDVVISDNRARVNDQLVLKPMQYSRIKGEDYQQGAKIVEKGVLLQAPQIAVAAAFGKSIIKVSEKPKIAIVSTGDEIVPVDTKQIKSYQSRASNAYFLAATFDNSNLFESYMFHLPDDKKILRKQMKDILKNFDVIVSSGGVSMGKFDYLPGIYDELEVEVLFHKVTQKPGKPFWFGLTKERKLVFALPGNPVSTKICAIRYVLKHLARAVGRTETEEYAVLTQSVKARSTLTYFLPVKIRCNELGTLQASPAAPGASGDFATVAKSDGFVQLPIGQREFEKGFKARLYRWI